MYHIYCSKIFDNCSCCDIFVYLSSHWLPLIQDWVMGATSPGWKHKHLYPVTSSSSFWRTLRVPRPDRMHSPSIRFWIFPGVFSRVMLGKPPKRGAQRASWSNARTTSADKQWLDSSSAYLTTLLRELIWGAFMWNLLVFWSSSTCHDHRWKRRRTSKWRALLIGSALSSPQNGKWLEL